MLEPPRLPGPTTHMWSWDRRGEVLQVQVERRRHCAMMGGTGCWNHLGHELQSATPGAAFDEGWFWNGGDVLLGWTTRDARTFY